MENCLTQGRYIASLCFASGNIYVAARAAYWQCGVLGAEPLGEGVADKQQSGENRSDLLGSEGETSPAKLLKQITIYYIIISQIITILEAKNV